MMKLYDRYCLKCGLIQRDVFAESVKQLERGLCACGGKCKWRPSFGSVDNQAEFYDIHTDRNYSSYREMERYCRENNMHILDKREYESNLGKTNDLGSKLSRNDKKLNEAIEKSYYRLSHGYKD